MTTFNPGRRKLLKASAAAGGAVAAGPLMPEAEAQSPKPAAAANVNVLLRVNGSDHQVMIDPRTTLLDALRERLHLTGTKKRSEERRVGKECRYRWKRNL